MAQTVYLETSIISYLTARPSREWEVEMPRPLREDYDRWEDPIVAEVRKMREELFAAAGYDLDEFCRRLRERQQKEGRQVITLPAREPQPRVTASASNAGPNKRMQPTRKKPARG